jgi:hypothetical protein
MRILGLLWDLKTLPVLLMLLLITNGCCSDNPDHALLFNVTGFLTAETEPNSTIYLFVVSDTSFDTALNTVATHSYLTQEPMTDQVNFRFVALPPGDYLAMVPRNSFPDTFQGFPIAREFNRSNYSLKVHFYGGNEEYSLLSFSIRPSLQGAKTEK